MLITCFRDFLQEKYNDPRFNTNVYLCMYPKDAKAFGVASLGGACHDKRIYHGALMGYDYSDMVVARVS
jgi:hypothetical protein